MPHNVFSSFLPRRSPAGARLALVVGVAIASVAVVEARAATVMGGGAVSYESIRPEGFDDENLGGFGISGLFQADVTKIAGPTGLLLGAEFQYFSVSGEAGNTEVEWTQGTFGPFFGLNVPVAARFTLQTTLGYDFGVSGEYSTKVGAGTEISRDTESFGRVRHDWRGVFDVTANMGVGFGLGFHSGSTELADVSGEVDFRGWGMKGVFLYTF